MANESDKDKLSTASGESTRPQHRVALLHHTGCGNLGDDAIIDAVVDNIRHRWPDAEIAVFSMNPDDTVKRHGIQSFPVRRYEWESNTKPSKKNQPIHSRFVDWLATTRNPLIRFPRAVWREVCWLDESYRRLRSFKLLIVSGGGQLTERGGPWSFPYALYVWSRMAKMANVRLVFCNVGAGPLHHPLSKWFVVRALRAASYVSFRNKESQDLATSLGFVGASHVFPDNAYSMDVASPTVSRKETRSVTVGVAPMPFPFSDLLKMPEDSDAIENELIDKLATFTRLLVEKAYSVTLFGSDVKADPPVIKEMSQRLLSQHDIAVPSIAASESVIELLSQMSKMDCVVTCRFHGVVFAHLLNKPVLAIAHHPKVTQLMNALGLSEYCVDMRTFDPVRLADKFSSLVASMETVKERMARNLVEYRSQLATQWDALFPPHLCVPQMDEGKPQITEVAL